MQQKGAGMDKKNEIRIVIAGLIFADKMHHVHMKDVAVTLDGRSGLLGSHIDFKFDDAIAN